MRVICLIYLFSVHCFDRQGNSEVMNNMEDPRMHESYTKCCMGASAEYELALILKELRWITEQVN